MKKIAEVTIFLPPVREKKRKKSDVLTNNASFRWFSAASFPENKHHRVRSSSSVSFILNLTFFITFFVILLFSFLFQILLSLCQCFHSETFQWTTDRLFDLIHSRWGCRLCLILNLVFVITQCVFLHGENTLLWDLAELWQWSPKCLQKRSRGSPAKQEHYCNSAEIIPITGCSQNNIWTIRLKTAKVTSTNTL